MIGKICRLNKICEWRSMLYTHCTLAVSIHRMHILEFVLSLFSELTHSTFVCTFLLPLLPSEILFRAA